MGRKVLMFRAFSRGRRIGGRGAGWPVSRPFPYAHDAGVPWHFLYLRVDEVTPTAPKRLGGGFSHQNGNLLSAVSINRVTYRA
jgi:hypothetical protein